jgi:hypothetical protein
MAQIKTTFSIQSSFSTKLTIAWTLLFCVEREQKLRTPPLMYVRVHSSNFFPLPTSFFYPYQAAASVSAAPLMPLSLSPSPSTGTRSMRTPPLMVTPTSTTLWTRSSTTPTWGGEGGFSTYAMTWTQWCASQAPTGGTSSTPVPIAPPGPTAPTSDPRRSSSSLSQEAPR